MAARVLNQVRRRMLTIERALNQGSAGHRELQIISLVIANLYLVEHHLRPETFRELIESLNELKTCIDSPEPASLSYQAPRSRTGQRGRPSIHVTRAQIQVLQRQGFTIKAMARNLGCSSSYLYKKSILLSISLRHRFTTIGDDELEQHISRLHQQCPQSGLTMMQGYLQAEGITVQRRRVREMLTRVDPAAAAQRWSNVVARRSYHVPFPNSLWHIDGHMRLIRWGFVTHARIDGRSRVITFLRCSTNNTATTVLSHFVRATCQYGVPSRVRSDCGGENTLVALLMTLLNGQGCGSHITGRSVHNQRIERLWRDVFIQVIHSFYNLFYSFEEDLILDPNDNIHRFSLHKTYLPEIQNSLDCFRVAWNSHSLRTEHNCTPNQIWMDGMLGNIHQNATAVQSLWGGSVHRGKLGNNVGKI
ncbi:uncharacterized protein LOC134024928 [Osmerus eperlanus]|uniref:uncharacterized protein LOC134024928 n=1 Tax=Osmerus eperlanus TaxID=29151 RepID=UPI002E1257BD